MKTQKLNLGILTLPLLKFEIPNENYGMIIKSEWMILMEFLILNRNLIEIWDSQQNFKSQIESELEFEIFNGISNCQMRTY